MRFWKSIITYLLMITMMLISTSCSQKDSQNEDTKDTKKISLIVKKSDASFWAVVKMGAEAAEKEFSIDVSFDGPTDENDISGQIAMVEKAIQNKVDAIILAACDYLKMVDVAEKAQQKGIPVIIIDSDIKSDKVQAFVGTDNIDAGEKLGKTVVDKVGTECRVAIINFVKGAATSDQREEGVYNILDLYPKIKVITNTYCNSNESVAYQQTMKIIEENIEIDAIICTNAYATVGAAKAIDEAGKSGEIKIFGFDSTPEEINYMEKGVIQALVTQNPFNMGYLGVKYAVDAINGKNIPKRSYTRSEIIDKDNMYLPENQKLLFPFTN